MITSEMNATQKLIAITDMRIETFMIILCQELMKKPDNMQLVDTIQKAIEQFKIKGKI